MSIGPSAVLASDEIEALERDVIAEAQAGRKQAAWHKVQPLRNASSGSPKPRWRCYGSSTRKPFKGRQR